MSNYQWVDRQTYPFASHHYSHPDGTIHYVDQGEGQVVVLLHGTPTWSYLYRGLIGPLSKQFRVIAPDMLGFGLSDKPRDVDYSVQAQAQRIADFLDQLEVPSFHLVVHDFGGPIGLNYALQHPDRIRSLSIANSWMWSARGEPAFEKMAKTLSSPLLPILYRWFNFSARVLLPQGFGNRRLLSKKIHRHYLAPLGRGQREAPLGLANSLLAGQDWFAGLWEQREQLAEIPALIIWGMKDRFLEAGYAERLASIWSESPKMLRLPEAGHFVWEEATEQILSVLREHLRG
ncbi:MAG: alpha/beta fold hydrolase [Bacteroidota bacterium]